MTLFFFVVGLGVLVLGAELLVGGASRLAVAFGISPLVVGLTVVAFGTSSPELAVVIQAGVAGQADLALGNVVGSNIFNVLFILGLAALITPLAVAQQLVRVDVPLLLGVSVLLYLFALDGVISRLDGLLLASGMTAYTIVAIRASRRESRQVIDEYVEAYAQPAAQSRGQLLLDLTRIVVGLALLIVGSRWLVAGAVALATYFGLSELVIGLTIIAVGTSLPEIATSILAAVRGERDIAVGNVVGSNLCNLLAVLGVASLVTPGGLPVAPAMLSFDLPVMLAVTMACLPIFFTGHRIARWEGALFLAYYVAYTAYLLMASTEHDRLPMLNSVMLLFVLPLTMVTIGIGVLRQVRARADSA
jgi:cation:H+ antiporter